MEFFRQQKLGDKRTLPVFFGTIRRVCSVSNECLSGVLENIHPVDIAWIAIILCGVPILVGAIKGVILEHDIKADVLVAMALVASVVTGEYFAAGEVALIMQIGSLLEDYTSGKAQELVVGHLMKGFFRPGTMQRISVRRLTERHLGSGR